MKQAICDLKGKRILVTGGAGFIGSHLVEALVKRGCLVTVVDNLKRGRIENLNKVSHKIEFVNKDLTEPNACNKVFKDQDIVFHLASDAYGLSYSYKHHSEILTNNLLINANVLNACQKNNIKKMLVVSSSCVYSDNAEIPAKESAGFLGEPEKANIGYGWSKRILEIQATHLNQEYGMEIAIIRPTNVYGPRDPISGKGTHVIPSLIYKILFEKGPVVVWGSGEQARNFIYVNDAVRAMLLTTEKYACAKPVNLGSNKATSMKELIYTLLKLTGQERQVIFDKTKPEGAKCKSSDISLIKKSVGFSPKVSLEEGLKETIKYYRQCKS